MSGFINYRMFSLTETPDLNGKIAVLTGGQAGIGKEIAAQLLLHNISKLYILARSKEKFKSAKDYWYDTHQISEEVVGRVEFIPCDLSDMVVVKKVADDLVKKLDRLDILINNAGLPTVPDYTLSPQGIETIWATNVVGHFILTNILLPRLESTAQKHGDSRIVTTSSSFHAGCQELQLDLTMSATRVKSPDAIDSCWRYARSKLGVILFTRQLAKLLEKRGSTGVYANTFFPGNIPSEAMDTWKELFGVAGGAMKGFFQVMGQSLADAAASAMYLATSGKVVEKGQKGLYFIPIAKEDKTTELAEDKDLMRNLWNWCDFHVTEALGKGWDEAGEEQ